jgi:hypothetical protein
MESQGRDRGRWDESEIARGGRKGAGMGEGKPRVGERDLYDGRRSQRKKGVRWAG